MNWIDVVWPMVAGACLALGVINLGIALAQPPRTARLLFVASALSAVTFSLVEVAVMHATDLASCPRIFRWGDLSYGAILVSLTAFIWVFFRSGNRWLALAVPLVYGAGLVFDYLPGSQLTYREFTGIKTLETFGGATYNVVEGVPNPWNVICYLAILMLLLFVIDASIRLWRRGEHRRAAVVGGAVVLTLMASGIHSALLEAQIIQMPYITSWAFLAILVAMGNELNVDVAAAAKLSSQLQQSERRIELAGAAANLGMWTWDVMKDEAWVSSRARILLGLSESESLNLARCMAMVHPDDRGRLRQAIERTLSGGEDYELEFRVQAPEEQTRWIAARGLVERDSRGEPTLMRGAVLDISARRRSELELQQLRGELAHSGRVSMMGQLATALAHELNQPIGAILHNAEAAGLFLQHNSVDLDELRAINADIARHGQRAGDVIEHLRTMLKRRKIEMRSLAVGELLNNVATLTHSEALARNITVDVEALPALPPVMGDGVHLQQVVLNLVLNAMDAIDDGREERRHVSLKARCDGERAIEVAVIDSGHGIAREKLGRVFDPFFTTKENGMGIGLPISRTIIEAHGGRIWVESNVPTGTTFLFTLPVAEQRVAT